ncbi:MAG TPA: response regulator [Planctomycetaceae bacterium]|nr:response regulator [Planctomycetaceae bacterium]
MRSTVSVIDDDTVVLRALRDLLHSRGYQVAVFRSAEDFLAVAREIHADCLVAEQCLPGLSGIELQKRVSVDDNIPVILLTGHGDVPTAVSAMKAGAFDFMEKPCLPSRLLNSVREAVVSRAGRGKRVERDAILQTLTIEERGVLHGMLQGHSNRDIAEILDLSTRTIQFRRNTLFRKLNVFTNQQVMKLAFDRGWTPDRIEP